MKRFPLFVSIVAAALFVSATALPAMADNGSRLELRSFNNPGHGATLLYVTVPETTYALSGRCWQTQAKPVLKSILQPGHPAIFMYVNR